MKIDVRNIFYSYDNGKTYAVKDASATFESGEFVAIVGHTGSGKSTFIQNLNGLLVPTSGEIDIDGYIIKNKIKLKNIKDIRKKIGIVFQFPEYQLFEETVEKDILFGPKNFNIVTNQSNELAKKVLDLVGLDESFLQKSPFELSGGEKRRVAIAGILASDPEVLIVDEPTAGLDPIAANKMMELFKKLNEMGKTIILITHQMDHVLQYASRVIVFKDGNIMCDKRPIDLFNNYDFVKRIGIDIPNIIKLVNLACEKYPKLKEYKIKDIDDFIKAYKDVIKL